MYTKHTTRLTSVMMNHKLATPLLGVLLWVISLHAGTFATLLPRPVTGVARSIFNQQSLNFEDDSDFHFHTAHLKIPEKDLNRSVLFGHGVVNRMLRLETNLGWSNIHVRKGTPSHGQLIVNSPEREALRQGRDSLVATKATIHLMNSFCHKYNLNPSECAKYISSYSLASTPLQSSCKKLRKVCSQEEILSSYRRIDGSCNHKNDGSVGAAFTGYNRLLHPEYLDGVQELRRAVSKKPLPSPRLISTSLAKHDDNNESSLTLAVMQWSQFIEHDLSHTATSKMVHTEHTIECCAPSGNNLSPRYIHPFCAPISVPYDDEYYSKHGLDCMPYVRSVPAFRSDCSFGPIDQVNQATHFMDASQIYGSTVKKVAVLRSFVDGQMDVTTKNRKVYLPHSEQPTNDCQSENESSVCFLSGDSRVNTHPQLTSMHTLWLREHNRIALALTKINPSWDDETLYQEARRIVIAEIQHITYNEWIPEVLGKKYHNKIQKYSEYDENVNPSVSNSFATAALRAFNSLMRGKLNMYKENRLVNISLDLRNYFNKPDILEEPGYLDAVVRGLATQSSKKLNFGFVEDISSNLFSNGVFGYDVFSLDIQRGRDHGISSYIAFRTLCGFPEVHDFADLLDAIPPEVVKSLSDVYNNPHDIDLIVGGMSERPIGDSLLGPTFSCIVADQFLRTRRGDRYFYSNDNQPAPFSRSQIKEIEKVTLARIFCDNSDDIKMMQPHVFTVIGESNPLADCKGDRIPQMNLRLWMDSRAVYY